MDISLFYPIRRLKIYGHKTAHKSRMLEILCQNELWAQGRTHSYQKTKNSAIEKKVISCSGNLDISLFYKKRNSSSQSWYSWTGFPQVFRHQFSRLSRHLGVEKDIIFPDTTLKSILFFQTYCESQQRQSQTPLNTILTQLIGKDLENVQMNSRQSGTLLQHYSS